MTNNLTVSPTEIAIQRIKVRNIAAQRDSGNFGVRLWF